MTCFMENQRARITADQVTIFSTCVAVIFIFIATIQTGLTCLINENQWIRTSKMYRNKKVHTAEGKPSFPIIE